MDKTKVPVEPERKQAKQERTHRMIRGFQAVYKAACICLVIALFFVLLIMVLTLPEIGNETNPSENEVVQRYVEKGLTETGAINIVAGIILDYRAFDTFGESNVLFVATCCVLILLRTDKKKKRMLEIENEDDRHFEPRHDTILQKISLIIVPITMMYGIYIILNGHLSPGGGFSGGAILGAALVLYLNAYGFKKTERFFNANTMKWVSFASLMVYCLAKAYSFYMGANGYDSGIPLGTPGAIFSSGLILLLNICVGLVVACTMYSFYALMRRGRI